MAQLVKNLPAVQEAQVQSLGWEDPLRKGMAAHSSILAWRIPWTEEPGGLQSTGMQRVRLLIFRGEKKPPTCLSQRVIFLPHSAMSCYHMIPLITIFSFIIQKVGSSLLLRSFGGPVTRWHKCDLIVRFRLKSVHIFFSET